MQKFHIYTAPKHTPQGRAIPGREGEMHRNAAGGFAFTLDKWRVLERFLILGTAGGTYYASERKQTQELVPGILECIEEDGPRVVGRVTVTSVEGRAPKNDPALFVLALCMASKNPRTVAAARVALPLVARTGTHLFGFVEYARALRGWGRALKRAVGAWYAGKDPAALGLQLVKYQQREGWSHRDLLRLSHPRVTDPGVQAALRWATRHGMSEGVPEIITGFVMARNLDVSTVEGRQELAWAITRYRLPRECVPTAALQHPEIWEALLPNMGYTALLRNLGNMSKVGLLAPLSDGEKEVVRKLGDADGLRRARVHPIAVLSAILTYSQGHGVKGHGTWTPSNLVLDALEAAFPRSFGNVEPAGKRVVLALDVSPSMGGGVIAGVPGLTPRLGACAMALITARTEPSYVCMAFAGGFTPFTISASEGLVGIARRSEGLANRYASTDCAVPMLWATRERIQADAFVIYTDNETWSGVVHPAIALEDYRNKLGIDAKLVVVGMTATRSTVGDIKDPGTLDVVGFDTATPNVVAGFMRGEF